ncbi:MAG: hypothetical protein U1E74_00065 [Paenacidovorax caeni]
MSTTPAIPVPQSAAPIDPATLAQWATSLPRSLPGGAPAVPVPGAQPPANWAPGGSPLAAPSGFSPNAGHAHPAGPVPGSNLLPSSPGTPLALLNRTAAAQPHAQAATACPTTPSARCPATSRAGQPDRWRGIARCARVLRAFASCRAWRRPGRLEPAGRGHPGRRRGCAGVRRGAAWCGPDAAPATPAVPQPGVGGAAPQFYFVDAVRLPSGYVTPAKPHPHPQGALAAQQDRHPAFDVHAVRATFPSCPSASTASGWCGWTTLPPRTSPGR